MSSTSSLLLETARRGELHHAIILHGPNAEALRALALQLAKTLNCLTGSTGDDCLSCQRVERRIHPDVHFVEVAAEKKMISVEQVRELLEGASLRPYEGRTKVFLIDPADGLSANGSNALLKTLEEPARDTSFILLTRTPDLLLPTIRSRSQSVFVGGVEQRDDALADEITALLQRFAGQGDAVALLALAATVAGQDDVKNGMALLGDVLCDAVGSGALSGIPAQRLLNAADGVMAGIRNLVVNADPRMVIEQALSKLVITS